MATEKEKGRRAVKHDFQLIGQSEDAEMRFRPKDGIEHGNYLRLKTW